MKKLDHRAGVQTACAHHEPTYYEKCKGCGGDTFLSRAKKFIVARSLNDKISKSWLMTAITKQKHILIQKKDMERMYDFFKKHRLAEVVSPYLTKLLPFNNIHLHRLDDDMMGMDCYSLVSRFKTTGTLDIANIMNDALSERPRQLPMSKYIAIDAKQEILAYADEIAVACKDSGGKTCADMVDDEAKLLRTILTEFITRFAKKTQPQNTNMGTNRGNNGYTATNSTTSRNDGITIADIVLINVATDNGAGCDCDCDCSCDGCGDCIGSCCG
jgi:hypothetical protein